jgi:SpoVK/Ycf46/Vps4 family AAA+-type ATPase
MRKKGLEKLKELKGLDYLSKEIEKLVKFAKSKQIKSSEKNSEITRLIPQNKKSGLDVNLHISLVGNPGTGKTTVAKIISEIFKDEGILEVGHIVKVTRNDLVGEHIGATAIKTVEKINQAIGGVLFIDEAYTLSAGGENDFGKEAIDTILEAMTDKMGEFAVIVAGYPDDMEKFLESNAGLKRRFANQILLKDYEPKVLENIFRNKVDKDGFNLDDELNNILPHFIENWFNARDERTFGNAGDILNIFDEMAKSAILDERKILTKSDIPMKFNQYLKQQSNNTMAKALAKLDNIIGLESVKENIKRIIASIKMEKLRGQNKKVIAGHYIFKGNPGTGKTTVARILGEILKELKVLKKGHFVEVTKEDLVQGYVGQTAIKTKEILNKSLGGVLFIDEAYSLSKGGENDFGKEAIDTIVPFMENNLADFTLIVAGYDDDMDKFLDANTGLKSRFTNTIIFEDYSNVEMLEIFKIFAKDYKLADGVETKLIEIFEDLRVNSTHFGNGRDARKIFGAIKSNLDMRLLKIEDLTQGDKRLNIIELEDVESL